MITKCPHQAAMPVGSCLLTNEQTRHHFQISMRCSRPISAHNSLGCGFDPGRCTKNASLEKINLLGRMDFSREWWLLHFRPGFLTRISARFWISYPDFRPGFPTWISDPDFPPGFPSRISHPDFSPGFLTRF
jgi:hypothetical protein